MLLFILLDVCCRSCNFTFVLRYFQVWPMTPPNYLLYPIPHLLYPGLLSLTAPPYRLWQFGSEFADVLTLLLSRPLSVDERHLVIRWITCKDWILRPTWIDVFPNISYFGHYPDTLAKVFPFKLLTIMMWKIHSLHRALYSWCVWRSCHFYQYRLEFFLNDSYFPHQVQFFSISVSLHPSFYRLGFGF